MKNLKRLVLNTIYFSLLVAITLVLSSLALTRRMNRFQLTEKPIVLTVKKTEITVPNTVSGRIESVMVKEGQQVEKGETLARLVDETAQKKLEQLRVSAKDNISAETEAKVLETQQEAYLIRSPRRGVVYAISAPEGTTVTTLTPLFTLFADDDIRLSASVDTRTYTRLITSRTMDVYSPRLGQIYSIELIGPGKVEQDPVSGDSRYEVLFRFSDPQEGGAFIQGEGLEIVQETRSLAPTPAERIQHFWNTFLRGETASDDK